MIRALCMMFALALPLVSVVGCNVAPKADDRESFVVEAREGLKHFESNVPGLKDQIKNSAGYAVFPGAGQWGIIFTGGSFGRGAVFNARGEQLGWAAVNNFNVGLQLGGQGKKILIVFANADVLTQFQTIPPPMALRRSRTVWPCMWVPRRA
jgi:lipid-binding SYLF domain-containing protein